MRTGIYAYRFEGFSVQPNFENSWYLVGIGTIKIEGDPKGGSARDGQHSTSIHRHNSSLYSFIHSHFKVEGTYRFDPADGFWKSTLTFKQTERSDGRKLQTLIGDFVITESGTKDQYWIISAGAEITAGAAQGPASEVVKGSLARTGDLTS